MRGNRLWKKPLMLDHVLVGAVALITTVLVAKLAIVLPMKYLVVTNIMDSVYHFINFKTKNAYYSSVFVFYTQIY